MSPAAGFHGSANCAEPFDQQPSGHLRVRRRRLPRPCSSSEESASSSPYGSPAGSGASSAARSWPLVSPGGGGRRRGGRPGRGRGSAAGGLGTVDRAGSDDGRRGGAAAGSSTTGRDQQQRGGRHRRRSANGTNHRAPLRPRSAGRRRDRMAAPALTVCSFGSAPANGRFDASGSAWPSLSAAASSI